jgi:methylenetetrahydrofolate dehydrogenase (NADP+)/methenyltetrahydrofolate cyclohydrolase
MKLLNGKELADKIKEEVRAEVEELEANGKYVSLAVIQVGDNAASSTYVKNKQNACKYCGIKSETFKLGVGTSEKGLINLINMLNEDSMVHGILVQLPLPEHIDEHNVIQSIAPEKDVDGFHEINVGKLMIGEETFVPCTTRGIIELLKENNIKIEGQNCVVVGRSNIVGKPTAIELLRNNGTVTICHSKTKGLKQICREADILVCAIGKPKFFNREYISPNTVVIDVGIHRQEDGTLCGDVDFEDVKDIVSAITPVPRGVGAMTVAMLMKNCVQAAQK